MAATYPESLPDPTAPEGWDPAAWIEIGRIRRLFPAVGAGESARPPTSLPSGWATGVQPPLDDDGGQLVVARSSPVADALDAGSLFTLGAWFDLTAE